MILKYLIEKEFKQLIRDPFIPKLIIVLPCLVMLIFPWATTMEIKHANLSIVDNDRSSTSRKFVDKLAATTYFNITDVSTNTDNAMKSIEYGISDVIVEIPNEFEKSIMREGKASVLFSANAINATKGSVATSYLDAIVLDFSNELTFENSPTIVSAPGGISIEPYYKFNPTMDYKIPMIPALIVLIMTLMCGFLPSMNIVGEKEEGTIEQINVTPVSKVTFILGKLIPYWIIGIVVFSLAMAVSLLLFGLSPVGSVVALYGVALIYIFAISGLGILISNYSNTLQQAMFMIFFFIVVMLLISGLFTPINSMPQWAQVIAYLNPLTYFVEIMRSLYLKGSTLHDVQYQIYALVVSFVILTTWAILSYRKRG